MHLAALVSETDAAFEARGVAGLVALMRAHCNDAVWQVTGCVGLLKLMSGADAEMKTRAGDAGAVEAVLAALLEFRCCDTEVSAT